MYILKNFPVKDKDIQTKHTKNTLTKNINYKTLQSLLILYVYFYVFLSQIISHKYFHIST